ncbi:synapse differentiation-inducing gene protein 1 [Narcine bancroftii]|uniref:synapse differentiation-inducing gene protein 1 n=1 Tax=Narcine bancroftii TaxID=1343680 RepID=UPI00383173E7
MVGERSTAMEDVHDLQRPLLSEHAHDSHPLLSIFQWNPTPGPDGTREVAWSLLTRDKPPPRANSRLAQELLETCSPRDAVESLGGPSLALQMEPGSLRGCAVNTVMGCKSAGEQNGKCPQREDLEVNLDNVPTISIDVADIQFLEMKTSPCNDTESDTESDSFLPLNIPQDHLGLAIFSMLCCFWPLGIAAFYLSHKISKATDKGDYLEARSASKRALCMSVCSIALGICTYIGGAVVLTIYMLGNGHV